MHLPCWSLYAIPDPSSCTPAPCALCVSTGNNTYFWPKTETWEKFYFSSFPCRSEDASSLPASSFSIYYWYFGTFKIWITICIPVPAESSPFERKVCVFFLFFFILAKQTLKRLSFSQFQSTPGVSRYVVTHPILFPSGPSMPPSSWERCVTMSSFGEPETR